jgi:hypothetical protein
VPQRKGDHAAQLRLGHRAEGEQWLGGDEGRALLLLDGEGANLRAVAMHDRYVPAALDQRVDAVCHSKRVTGLLGVGAALPFSGEGVSAQSHDRGTTHTDSPEEVATKAVG